MLFTEIERTDTGSPLHAESRYAYLNRSARPEAARVRACLEDWFYRYPEANRAAFIPAFRSNRDTQFHAAAHELYLHELLCRLGYEVTVHPDNPTGRTTRPDFFARTPSGDSEIYVEAVLATELSDAERGAEARMNGLYDALNRLKATDFYIGLDMEGAPATPPPSKTLRASVEKWLNGLDADAVTTAVQRDGPSAYPRYLFDHAGWRIEITAYPKSKENRGNKGVRAIGAYGYPARMLSTWEHIRDAILSKRSKYGDLPAPLVVAVNVLALTVDPIDVSQALFGQEQYFFPQDPQGQNMKRAPNGVWHSRSGLVPQPSTVLISPNLDPWAMAARSIRLYHNPWATNAFTGPICSLPQCVPEADVMTDRDGVHPRELLGLPEYWPGDGSL